MAPGGRWTAPAAATSRVLVADRRTGTVAIVGARQASDPALSPDGRWVAYVETRRGGAARVVLADLTTHTRRVLALPAGRPLSPAVARDGAAVAVTLDRGARSQIAVWRATTGIAEIASRAGGPSGALGTGRSVDPSISADGLRVAFASSAGNLVPGLPPGPRAVYVRDVATGITTRVSDTARAYPVTP